MSEFDKWWEYHRDAKDSLNFHDAKYVYESQQAKIDEIQRKYDAMYNAFIVTDDCRKEWYESYMSARKERDDLQAKYDELNNRATGIALDQMTTAKLNYELQGRIDEAMDYIAESGGVNLTSEIALNYILKGNKDENRKRII